MGNDDAKRLILARRSRFIAAALASVAAACGGSTDPTTEGPRDAQVPDDAEPQVCLSPPKPPKPDASTDAGVDADTDAEPRPCLSPLPPDAGDGG